jgi:hypothetical protein
MAWTRVAMIALFFACTPPTEQPAETPIDPASLLLPHSSTAEPAMEDLPVVIATKTQLILSGVPRASATLPIGVESMAGPIIDPLQGWLKDAHLQGKEMAVAFDSATKADLAMEVLATCMDAGFDSFHVAVIRSGATAQIPLSFGKPDPPNAKWLTALVFGAGVVLKVAEGTVAPGCDGLGSGVSVSRVDGVIDDAKLGQCVARVHKEHQTNAASVLVTKDTVFRDVVKLLDTMRQDAETPAITLGISG